MSHISGKFTLNITISKRSFIIKNIKICRAFSHLAQFVYTGRYYLVTYQLQQLFEHCLQDHKSKCNYYQMTYLINKLYFPSNMKIESLVYYRLVVLY